MAQTYPPPRETVPNSSLTLKQINKRKRAIQDLQRLAIKLRRTPAADDVREASKRKGCPAVVTYQSYFGSFANALRAAKLQVRNPETAVTLLQILAAKLGRAPTVTDVRAASRRRECVSVATLRNYFGSFNNALRAAGLPINQKQKTPRS